MGSRWHGEAPELFASSQETRVGFCQLCVAAKQSLNVSKGECKSEPESKGLNYNQGSQERRDYSNKVGVLKSKHEASLQDGIEGRQHISRDCTRALSKAWCAHCAVVRAMQSLVVCP